MEQIGRQRSCINSHGRIDDLLDEAVDALAAGRNRVRPSLLLQRADGGTNASMIPLSERTIFNMEQRALTRRSVAWDLAEVEAWIEARKASCQQADRPGGGR